MSKSNLFSQSCLPDLTKLPLFSTTYEEVTEEDMAEYESYLQDLEQTHYRRLYEEESEKEYSRLEAEGFFE